MGLFDALFSAVAGASEYAQKKQNEMYGRADGHIASEGRKRGLTDSQIQEKQRQLAKARQNREYERSTHGLTKKEIRENRELLEMFDLEDDIESAQGYYRKVAIRNTPRTSDGKYICPKCQKTYSLSEMDADHIVPKSKGGDNYVGNLQLICKHCNRSKQDDTSETKSDLRRRKYELDSQYVEDMIFLNKTTQKIKRKSTTKRGSTEK